MNINNSIAVASWALLPGAAERDAKTARSGNRPLDAGVIEGVGSIGEAIYVGVALAVIGSLGAYIFSGTVGKYGSLLMALGGASQALGAMAKLYEEILENAPHLSKREAYGPGFNDFLKPPPFPEPPPQKPLKSFEIREYFDFMVNWFKKEIPS